MKYFIVGVEYFTELFLRYLCCWLWLVAPVGTIAFLIYQYYHQ